ncbi:MAG: insulinase family protein [Nitrospirota bacterium]|nr:insulinase family protein [Nitrospirota bacterium]
MYQKSILDNGIRVVSEAIPHVKSVSIGVWVNTGSRNEREDEHGVSHFLEHMVFKGTVRRTARDIAIEIDSIGGELNAFTSRENTAYYVKVLDEHLPVAVDLLSDIVLHSTLNPDDIATERKVILEEIKMVEDTPDDFIHDLFTDATWGGNPLGRSILGTHQSVGALNRDNLTTYIERRYLPEEIVISVAGNIDHVFVMNLLQRTFGRLERKGSIAPLTPPRFTASVLCKEKKLEQVQICMGAEGLSQVHEDRYAAYVLNAVLGSSMSSRLFQEIREQRGLAYSIYSYLQAARDAGVFAVYAGTSPDTAGSVIELTMDEIGRIRETPLTPSELQKAKDQIKGNLMLSLESTQSRMSQLAKQELYFGRYFPLEEILREIDAVTAEKVLGIASSIFKKGGMSLATLGPVTEKDLPLERLNG